VFYFPAPRCGGSWLPLLAAPAPGLAEAARRTGMSEADVLDLALARSAWKSTVAVRIGAGNARLKWSKTPLPALENLG
jgi:hypothetical protein